MTDTVSRLTTALASRYRLERPLGQGGMATVYLAHDLRHNRKVAVKVLRPELTAALGAERFLKEIEVTANLHHPHILPLFDSGEADTFLYYVMPYVEDQSLREKLTREGRLSLEEAVRIFTEVGGALDHAHRHGVLHRDVKPGLRSPPWVMGRGPIRRLRGFSPRGNAFESITANADPSLRALDPTTGDVFAKIAVPGNASCAMIPYEARGRQHIAIPLAVRQPMRN